METREYRAANLLERLKRGPHWCTIGPKPGRLDQADADEATQQYRLWAETWILPEIAALVPELKETEVE